MCMNESCPYLILAKFLACNYNDFEFLAGFPFLPPFPVYPLLRSHEHFGTLSSSFFTLLVACAGLEHNADFFADRLCIICAWMKMRCVLWMYESDPF